MESCLRLTPAVLEGSGKTFTVTETRTAIRILRSQHTNMCLYVIVYAYLCMPFVYAERGGREERRGERREEERVREGEI